MSVWIKVNSLICVNSDLQCNILNLLNEPYVLRQKAVISCLDTTNMPLESPSFWKWTVFRNLPFFQGLKFDSFGKTVKTVVNCPICLKLIIQVNVYKQNKSWNKKYYNFLSFLIPNPEVIKLFLLNLNPDLREWIADNLLIIIIL